MNSKNNESNEAKCFKDRIQRTIELLEKNKTSLINKELSVCNAIETAFEHTKHSLTPHKDNFFKICIKRLENNKKRVTFATKTKDFDQ